MTSTYEVIWVPNHLKTTRSKSAKKWSKHLLGLYDKLTFSTSGIHKLVLALFGIGIPLAGYSLQHAQLDITRLQEAARYIEKYENENEGSQRKWVALEQEYKVLYEKFKDNQAEYDREVFISLGMNVDQERTVFIEKKNAKKWTTVHAIAKHFRKVVRCVVNERCSEDLVKKFYRKDMCSFRRYLFPYVAVLSVKDAKSKHNYEWKHDERLEAKLWQPEYGD